MTLLTVPSAPSADELDDPEVQAFLFMVTLANSACPEEGSREQCDARVRKALSDLCEAIGECESAADQAALAAGIAEGAGEIEELVPDAFEALERIAAHGR